MLTQQPLAAARRWLVAALFSLMALGLFASAAAAQQIKIAYVDLQRALNSVEDGKKAKSELKGMFDQRQKKLDSEQEELKKFKEALEKELQSDLLGEEKKREKMIDYQRRFYELQNLYLQLQKELSTAEAERTKKIFGRFQEVLQEIGLKEGYTIILEKTESSVLWAPKSLDITDQLIQNYNKK
jgi:outer membrane protein